MHGVIGAWDDPSVLLYIVTALVRAVISSTTAV
jgi:hypothetical protein